MATRLPLKFRGRILHALEGAMYWSGAGFLYSRPTLCRGAVILMYHSIAGPDKGRFIDPRFRVEPETFEAQMRFLARHRRVVSITELVDTLREGRSPEPFAVAITFDDGYLDNLEIAAPVLERYGLPAIVYLPTGYIRDGETQWVDGLYTMFSSRTRDRIIIDNGDPRSFDLSNPTQQLRAYELLGEQLIGAQRADREAILHGVQQQLRPEVQPPRLTLDWDGVRELVRRYPRFEVGVHTVDHVDLATRGPDIARSQLFSCVAEAQCELDRPVWHFSFPYGRCTLQTKRVVKEVGLRSAVAGGNKYLIDERADVFAMPRIDPPSSMTLFRFRTSGAYPGLPMALVGKA